jgi:predicted restriction endonuclease
VECLKTCTKCEHEFVGTKRRKLCTSCSLDKITSLLTKKRLFEKSASWQSARSRIQRDARKVLKDEDRLCKICGYNNHVEVCHIKPVSLFTEEAIISDINHKDNLIMLCPNHHWEFDNAMLKLD